MVTPGTLNLTVYQGTTFRTAMTWSAAGQPVDLTGWSAHLQAREETDSPDVLLDLSTANGGILLGGSTGAITLFLSADQTAQLTFDQALYDLKLTAANGDVIRLLKGKVRVSPEVTQ